MKKIPGDIFILQLCTTNDNYDVWFLRYGMQQTEYFVILDYFLPFFWKEKIQKTSDLSCGIKYHFQGLMSCAKQNI